MPRTPEDCHVIVPFVIDEMRRTDVGSIFTVNVLGNSTGREDTVSRSAEELVRLTVGEFVFLIPIPIFLNGRRLY